MTRPSVSVVIPFFNAQAYLERCIASLLSQRMDRDRFEILMVDNNSTDGSAAIVKRFSRVRLLEEPKQGSYAARNRGVRAVSGEIVAFTDPDCEAAPDWLDRAVHAFSDPSVSIVLGDRGFQSDQGILGLLSAYESALVGHIFRQGAVPCYFAYTNNMAVRLSLLHSCDGFPEVSRGGDSLFLRQAISAHGPSIVRYEPAMYVRHLEIETIRDYLEKKRVYGEVNRDPRLATPAVVAPAIRLSIARKVACSAGAPLVTSIGFLGVLAAGAVLFQSRSRAGRFGRRCNPE